ncbi:MAG: Holliday junction resolvase RuvX [Boseongicola sp. SB0675_bin_26]|nr:Holliday junction resolvase RuvX [Boseongicola sp. SB0675_bin_26]
MICDDIESLAAMLPASGALAGIDLGTATIGVAASDARRRVASPVETIRRTKPGKDISALMAICAPRDVVGMVLGLPLNMDGSEGPRCQATRAFARVVARSTELPVAFWDERLSTVAAERVLLEADMSRRRRGQVIDHVAASYILQGALDRICHLGAT